MCVLSPWQQFVCSKLSISMCKKREQRYHMIMHTINTPKKRQQRCYFLYLSQMTWMHFSCVLLLATAWCHSSDLAQMCALLLLLALAHMIRSMYFHIKLSHSGTIATVFNTNWIVIVAPSIRGLYEAQSPLSALIANFIYVLISFGWLSSSPPRLCADLTHTEHWWSCPGPGRPAATHTQTTAHIMMSPDQR